MEEVLKDRSTAEKPRRRSVQAITKPLPVRERIEIVITRAENGSVATPDEVVEAVAEALRRAPPPEGAVFVLLGLEYHDAESLLAAVRALQPLWE
jgi:hypothetical protein